MFTGQMSEKYLVMIRDDDALPLAYTTDVKLKFVRCHVSTRVSAASCNGFNGLHL
jgi:hypothetical protein